MASLEEVKLGHSWETGKTIIFPDAPKSGATPERPDQLIAWHGRCEVHERFTPDDIDNIRKQFPDVIVLAHPECSPEVVAKADFSGSTTAMIRFVKESQAPRYLLLTECSMADNIIAENPDKEMVRLCSVRCPHMNQITLEDTLAALENLQYEITLPEEIIEKAQRAVNRMILYRAT